MQQQNVNVYLEYKKGDNYAYILTGAFKKNEYLCKSTS